MVEMVEYLDAITEDNKYVVFNALHEKELRCRRYLSTAELSFLVSNYVSDYFNGLAMEDGTVIKEEIGKNAFNPNYARRQFNIHLANLALGWNINGEEATKLEEVGFFDNLLWSCFNAQDALDRAKEVIEHELSVGHVVQAFLTKFAAIIPEPTELKEMIGDFAESINKVAPDRLPFIADIMGGKSK